MSELLARLADTALATLRDVLPLMAVLLGVVKARLKTPLPKQRRRWNQTILARSNRLKRN